MKIRYHIYTDTNKEKIIIFILLSILFFMMQYVDIPIEGFTFDLNEMVDRYEVGSNYKKISLIILGLFGSISLLGKWQKKLAINGFLGWLILFYLAFGCLSILWAEDSFLTIKRLASVFIMNIGVLAVIRRFSLKDMIDFIIFTTVSYVIAGFIYEIANGLFLQGQEGYRFAGMFHPNSMGLCCGLLFISVLSRDTKTEKQKNLYLLVAFLAVIFLVLTKSRTTLIGAGLALSARWVLVLPLSRKLMMALAVFWIGCFFMIFMEIDISTFFQKGILLGRADSNFSTLSGRTLLWKECLEDYASQRPLLGYGFGGFWGARHVYDISITQGWSIGIGHSTYIDQLLELGIIGLGTYIVIMTESVRLSILYFKKTLNTDFVFLLSLFILVVSIGFLETVIPYPSFFSFVIFWGLGCLAFTKKLNHE